MSAAPTSPNPPLLDRVLTLLNRGWSIIPVRAENKRSLVKWSEFQQRVPTESEVINWERQFRPQLWAVVTGRTSGVVVIDFDGAAGMELKRQWGIDPHVQTGSGGVHFYVGHPGFPVPTLNSKAAKVVWPWPGLDVRGDGGYAAIIGQNASGPYQALRELVPEQWPALPQELRDFLYQHRQKEQQGNPEPIVMPSSGRVDAELLVRRALDSAPSDGRNNAGMWLACQLRDNGYSKGEALTIMRNYRSRAGNVNAKGQREPYLESEIMATVDEAFSRTPREPWADKRNDRSQPEAGEPDPVECYAEGQRRMATPSYAATEGAESAWKDLLLRGKPRGGEKGSILAILANAIIALRKAPEWNGVLAFDEFAVQTVTLKAAPWHEAVAPWNDTDDIRLADWLQGNGICVSREVAGQAVEVVSKDTSFHPVREYLEGLAWDGKSRLSTWLTVYAKAKTTPETEAYVSAVGMRTLIAAVARVYIPGCKVDTCLIMESPQGFKKSTALRTMAPKWFADEIADLGSKDAAMQIRGKWIYELGELDALNRTESSRVKAFMSRSTDHFRPPYGKRVVDQPRQCIFIGSVNGSNYLRDETGGRRFWPVACGQCDIEALERDREQIWAEAKVRFDDGEPWWLEGPELNAAAAREQADRYEGDAWDSLIAEFIEGRVKSGTNSVSIPEVLQMCIGKSREMWTRADEMRVARSLRSQRWERYRDRERGMEWRYRPMEAKCS